MVSRKDTPFYTSVIFSMDQSARKALASKILSETVKQSKRISQDVRDSELVGLTNSLEVIRSNKVEALVFDTPALVYASKKSPIIFIIGPEIQKGIKVKSTKAEGSVRERHFWVDILKKSSPQIRSQIKKAIFDGMEYFDASWRKSSDSDSGYELKSKNSKIVDLTKSLRKGKGLKFLGFSPNVSYIRVKGRGEEMDYNWVHPFSTPTLCFQHKSLPLYFIAGPNIMYNDSMLRRNADNMIYDSVFGVTG